MAHNFRHERGSEWRQWDLHIHTPASFHWAGKKFNRDPASPENKLLVDEMIAAMNAASPDVFAIMDYWTFDGWFALRSRMKDGDCPELKKKVFPGIELRLAAPMRSRLNAHVIFSDDIEDHYLHEFMGGLNVEKVNRTLSNDIFILLARELSDEVLKHHGFSSDKVKASDEIALLAGMHCAKISASSYQNAIKKIPDGRAIGFMPFDTSDGLDQVERREHYEFFLSLVTSSPIFESRKKDLRDALVNEETPENSAYIKDIQAVLKNVPRLVVSGSDAHQFFGVKGNPNKRGYGDFPSGKATWIKADPTFSGLLQAIREPAKRSFIGEKPPKLLEIDRHKTYFIDSIEVKKIDGASAKESWLDGVNIPLNYDLIAVIGNKGSGKSALADIVAMLGKSRQKSHFSFLKHGRFYGKSGEPAKSFVGKLTWRDGTDSGLLNLSEDSRGDKVELVRYIPQGHFEDLCAAHITGASDVFEQELRAVIFSHADETLRLGAHDFDQLAEMREGQYLDSIDELRKSLSKINREISSIEDQLQPDVRGGLNELLFLKKNQIEEHRKIRPPDPSEVTSELSETQRELIAKIDGLKVQHATAEQSLSVTLNNLALNGSRRRAGGSLKSRVALFDKTIKKFIEECQDDAKILGLEVSDFFDFRIDSEIIDSALGNAAIEQHTLDDARERFMVERGRLLDEIAKISTELDAPELERQESIRKLSEWQQGLDALIGSPDFAESLRGIEARIAQLNSLPNRYAELSEKRISLVGEIFDSLDSLKVSREELFVPVQELIANDSLIRDEYKLQFKAGLHASADNIWSSIFSVIKQTVGDFRGEEESRRAIQKLIDSYDLTVREGVVSFVEAIHKKIVETVNAGTKSIGIRSSLKKDRSATELYDAIFGLSFVRPRYSLLFQETPIEQLSPGQRGALLLIFYLLVDRGRNPIILDQPEENLDNETVVGLLVPVLTKAKVRRQIIMVTHNPNLAVVCDAEQIIYSSFDRKDDLKITYLSGSIESECIRSHVVNVLEGTMPAFNNRKIKYY